MHTSGLSEVFWEVALCAYKELHELITTFHSDLMQECASLYPRSIHDAGGELERCIGFMDGTKIQMARPGSASIVQRSCYSGHKGVHCLLY